MNPFAWMPAQTVADAAKAATVTVADAMCAVPGGAADGAVVKAGGIDLLDLLKQRLLAPKVLIGLAQIPGLDRIEELADGAMRVGAQVTLAQLATHALVRRRYPALCDAVAASASPQIRAVATLGGNLLQRPHCWYFRAEAFRCLRKGGEHCHALAGENQYHAIFDNRQCAIVHPSTPATVLVALGASVELTDAAGALRCVRLEEFFVAPAADLQRENDLRPHEILTAILLPPIPESVRMAHLKQGEKDAFDWPLADVAVVLDIDADGLCRHAAVVLGAAAPVPHRARAAEAALVGRHVDDAVARTAGLAALEGATPLARNAYKLPLFEALVRRAILKAARA